jgi:ABC-type transporter lipoprotein component MlaA
MSLPARIRLKVLALSLSCLVVLGCASQAPLKRDPRDPWERMNRVTFNVNEKLDRAIAKPVAKAYRRYTPHFVQTGVSNFMDNLNYPIVIVNDVLQAKFKPALSDSSVYLQHRQYKVSGADADDAADDLPPPDPDAPDAKDLQDTKPTK